jgi:type II secretory pathway predicted ATPase ExeA
MHEEALERMMYAVLNGVGAAMITGDVGCGKTMLSHVLIERLARENYQVVSMTNPALEPTDFLRMTLNLFQAPHNNSDWSKVAIWRSLESHLKSNLERGKGSVLVVDEAQVIQNVETLQEVRMLLNLQSNGRFLLNLILLGQLELEDQISRIEPLQQRIAIKFRLGPLGLQESVLYIGHRLKVAGCKKLPFTVDALRSVLKYTGCIPREINKLCGRSLLAAYLQNSQNVTEDIVEEAWRDLHNWQSKAVNNGITQ